MPRNNPLPLLILPKTSEIHTEKNMNLDGRKIEINITTRNAEGRVSKIYNGKCNVVQIAEEDKRNCALITENDITFVVDEEVRFAQLPSPSWNESDIWIDPVRGPNASLYKGLEKRFTIDSNVEMFDIQCETHVINEVPQNDTNVANQPTAGSSSAVNNIEEYFICTASESVTSDASKPQSSDTMETDQNIQNVTVPEENGKEFVCFECGKSYTIKKSFKAHQRKHKNQDLKKDTSKSNSKEDRPHKRKLKCHYCKFTCPTIDDLIFHLEFSHHKFTCKYKGCHTIFDNLTCLLDHQKLHRLQAVIDNNCSSGSGTTQVPENQHETMDSENGFAEEQKMDIANSNVADKMPNATKESKKTVKKQKRTRERNLRE